MDPGGAKEAAGWLVSERPPAHWWNWILNSFGQWLTWAETSIDAIEPLVPQVLGKISVSSGTATEATGGTGIDSDATTAYSNRVDVYFDTVYSNTQYIALGVSSSASNDHFITVAAAHVAYCTVKIYDLSTGAIIDPTNIDCNFFLSVTGVQ